MIAFARRFPSSYAANSVGSYFCATTSNIPWLNPSILIVRAHRAHGLAAIHTTCILSLPINKGGKAGVHASKRRARLPPRSRTFIDPQVQAIYDCGDDWKRALKLLNEMGPNVSLPAYHEAIGVCSRNRQADAARSLLGEMRDAGVVPTVFTYNNVMSAFSKLGRWKEALDLMDELKEQTLRPSVVTFNTAINICGNGGQWQTAVELLGMMREYGVKPNVISFSAAISACEKAGKWEKALELLESMEACSVKPNVITFNAAISACEKAGKWEKALGLIDSMDRCGVEPNVITFSAAISACEKGGKWKKAVELLESMTEYGLEPNVITFSACIEALHSASRFGEAVGLMKKARNDGFYSGAWSLASEIDLHECSAAVTHTILRLLLLELRSGARTASSDITIIPGRGNRSGEKGAVLPHQARTFLRENGGPEITEVPQNPGCFLLTLEEIEKWRAEVRPLLFSSRH